MAYANSKLANILFTRELSRRLADSRVTVNALHPGVINTELVRNIGSSLKYFQDVLVRPFQFMFFKTPLEGAQTTLFAGWVTLFKHDMFHCTILIAFFQHLIRLSRMSLGSTFRELTIYFFVWVNWAELKLSNYKQKLQNSQTSQAWTRRWSGGKALELEWRFYQTKPEIRLSWNLEKNTHIR